MSVVPNSERLSGCVGRIPRAGLSPRSRCQGAKSDKKLMLFPETPSLEYECLSALCTFELVLKADDPAHQARSAVSLDRAANVAYARRFHPRSIAFEPLKIGRPARGFCRRVAKTTEVDSAGSSLVPYRIFELTPRPEQERMASGKSIYP
jgi:hypothetical protein